MDSLRVSEDLIMLERDKEELLLVSSSSLQPLYVESGRGYVKKLLEQAKILKNVRALEDKFPTDKDLINTLIQHEILVSEAEKTRSVEEQISVEPGLQKTNGISLYLLLSQSCNMGCVYCLNGTQSYKTMENLKMSREVAFRSIEKSLAKLNETGTLEIVFFGGEPLLNWPLAKEIIKHCEKVLKPMHEGKTVKYHMTTNLSFLPDDLIDWARDHGISFLCDIDGPEEIHNMCRPYKGGKPSYADVLANVRRLIMAGLDVSLRATITSVNQSKMVDIALHHKALGSRGCGLVPLNPVNSDEELIDPWLLPDADKLIEGLEKVYYGDIWGSERLFPFSVYASKIRPGTKVVLGCGAPYGNTPVVDVNGDVYPCIYLMGIKRFYMGNIMQAGYPDHTVLHTMIETLHVDHLEECKTCSWRYICGGGCPVTRLTIANNPNVTHEIKRYCSKINCEYTQKILELLFWELAEEASECTPGHLVQDSSVAVDPSQTIHC